MEFLQVKFVRTNASQVIGGALGPLKYLLLYDTHFNISEFYKVIRILLAGTIVLAIQLSTIYIIGYRHITSYEYHVIFLTLVGFIQIISMVSNLILLITAIEVTSLCIFSLIGQTRYSLEASLKYFTFSAFTTPFFLLGLVIAYATLLSVECEVLKYLLEDMLATDNSGRVYLIIAFLIGFLFKLAIFPCAMWAPDVYQGAINPITFVIATIAKTGFFAAFVRIFLYTLASLSQYWQPLILICVIGSLITGAIGAIRQDNMKRFLAFSSMHHISFIIGAILSASVLLGINNALTYLVIYVITLSGFFLVYLSFLNTVGAQVEYITDLHRIDKSTAHWPTLSITLVILLFSMAGVPPLVGFYAKFIIFNLFIKEGLILLYIISVITSFISIFNYLRLIRISL